MLRRRWPRASRILVIIAVLLGGSAFALVRGYQQRVEARHPAVGPTVAAVVAAADLMRGTVLSVEMLETSSVPAAYLPPGAVRDPASIPGRVLAADVRGGEILTEARLAGSVIGPVAALVPDGLRAVVVPSGVPASALRPGDRVDVYATYGGGRPHTELVAGELEVVRILADAPIAPGIGGTTAQTGAAVVLLADDGAAARLAYARAFGQLQIAILGPEPTPSPTA